MHITKSRNTKQLNKEFEKLPINQCLNLSFCSPLHSLLVLSEIVNNADKEKKINESIYRTYI